MLIFFLLTVCGAALLPVPASAQGLIQTMAEQLAKLELTLQEAKQGYAILQSGLTAVGDIKKGQLDLHSVFFSSLMQVNPVVKKYSKVADILSMQVQILSVTGQGVSQFVQKGSLTAQEDNYLSAVFSNLTTLTNKDVDELTIIVSDGQWQMTDDERLIRIDALYKTVSDKLSFVKTFSSQTMVFAQQRAGDKITLQNLQKMIGQ